MTIRKLPTGIYWDRDHFRVHAFARGQEKKKRFPADTTTAKMLSWQSRTRAAILEQPEPVTPKKDEAKPATLLEDIEDYLKLVGDMPTLKTRRMHLGQWAAELGGNRSRNEITPLEISKVLAHWKETRHYANQTLNLRRDALSNLYKRLDPIGTNPVRGVAGYPDRKPEPRGLPLEIVQAILDELQPRDTPRLAKGLPGGSAPSRTAAVLRVCATTGLPPATIARLTPHHLAQLDKGILLRPGRKKGRGTATSRHKVTPAGVAALRALAAIKAWGPIPSSTRLIVWRRAVAKVRAAHPTWEIPLDVVPTDLRHSIGDAVYEASDGRLEIVQEVLGHADIRTTQRYAAAAIQRKEAATIDQLAEAWKQAEIVRSGEAKPPHFTSPPALFSGKRRKEKASQAS